MEGFMKKNLLLAVSALLISLTMMQPAYGMQRHKEENNSSVESKKLSEKSNMQETKQEPEISLGRWLVFIPLQAVTAGTMYLASQLPTDLRQDGLVIASFSQLYALLYLFENKIRRILG
jgi:hypothetical protein